MSLYGSLSYSAGNSSALQALPTGTAPVAQPQLCFVGIMANRLPGLGAVGDRLGVYFGQSYVTGCIMCS